MSYRIPETFVQSVLSRVDLVGLINQRVPLKKQAQHYLARCPFHTEKTASFSVNPIKQFYYCFGCHAHGDAIQFLMEFEGMSFIAAVEQLAQQLGLSLPHMDRDEHLNREEEGLYRVLQVAARFYQVQLRRHLEAPKAIDYLKARGLSGQVAKDFGLGFAPPAWDLLTNHLRQEGFETAQAVRAGLIIQKENGHCYDRFRDRIMFPLFSTRGQILGFGGRIIDAGEPKYLNSPESPVFNKSQELYGLFQARNQRQLARLLIVEGYLDVISLVQFDFKETVATLGTALTAKHLELISRYTHEIIFCFDGDKPGRDALKRALHLSLPLLDPKRRWRFLQLPEGSDPDSFVRQKGADAFKRQLDASISIVDFLFQTVIEGEQTDTIEGRARIVAKASPLLESVRSKVYRDMLYQRLSQLVRIDAHILQNEPAAPSAKPQVGKKQATSGKAPPQTPLGPAQKALSLLFKEPSLLQQLGDLNDIRHVQQTSVALLCEIARRHQAEPALSLSDIVAAIDPVYRADLELPLLSHFANIVPEAGRAIELKAALQSLKTIGEGARLEFLLNQARQNQLNETEKQELRHLLQKKEAKG